MPDAAYAAVRWRVELSSGALGPLSDGPGLAPFPLASDEEPPREGTTSADRARDLLAHQVREQTSRCWARLLAIETVAAEAEAVLGDPAVVPASMISLLTLGLLPDADLALVEELRLGVHRH